MKLFENIRTYTWIEFLIWFVILAICILSYRFYNIYKHKTFPSYQIFMQDVDGMIVGSPVRYMGVNVGYIKSLKVIDDNVYVKFVITSKNVELPPGTIATVEFNGMGGSKSLELYPPSAGIKTNKLIVVRSTIRLNDAFSLFNEMFVKIDSITNRFTHFGDNMGVITNNKIKIDADNIGVGIRQSNKFVDDLADKREMIRNKWKGIHNEKRSNNK